MSPETPGIDQSQVTASMSERLEIDDSLLLDWYEDASGHSMEDIDFHLSLSSRRLASILEGIYSRYVSGAIGGSGPEGGAEVPVSRIDALNTPPAGYTERVA